MDVALAGYLKKQIQKYAGGVDLDSNKTETITTNGTHVINPSSGKDGMEKATVTVNVSAKVEEKAVTIDVSTYTDPVEITPTSGKDGMSKVTATLSNIPVAGAKLAKWTDGDSGVHYFNIEEAPEEGTDILQLTASDGIFSKAALVGDTDTYAKTYDTEFTVTDSLENTVTYTRDSTGDVTLW